MPENLLHPAGYVAELDKEGLSIEGKGLAENGKNRDFISRKTGPGATQAGRLLDSKPTYQSSGWADRLSILQKTCQGPRLF